ncbi:MAG: hypothetical protein PHV42_03875 [Candidatus Pacebacteria bacterium]|nr:hypothetical protein [Candidatus Paceibacterota bacterium]
MKEENRVCNTKGSEARLNNSLIKSQLMPEVIFRPSPKAQERRKNVSSREEIKKRIFEDFDDPLEKIKKPNRNNKTAEPR